MLITSKFPGRCNDCGKAIQIGDRVSWVRTIRGASHAACSVEGMAVVQAQAASRAIDAAPEIVTTLPVPSGLAYLPYQRAGIAYAQGKIGTLIADEMGLGKTIQAIGVINATRPASTCIVCPASLKLNWARECNKWLVDDANIHVLNGKISTTIHRGERAGASLDVRIVNYDILKKLSSDYTPALLVVDEGHYAKNPKATRTKLLSALAKRVRGAGGRVVMLTGTPILNKPIELWALLQIVAPAEWDPAGSLKGKTVDVGEGAGFFRFAKRYCAAHQEWVTRQKQVWVFDGASNLDELQERLRISCMVRRLKVDVLRELPPKRRQVIELPCEQSWDESDPGDDLEGARRHLPSIAFEQFSSVRHAQAVTKLPQVIDHVRGLLEETAKAVIFAHHQDVIHGLVEALSDAGAVRVDGTMSGESRQASVDRFQSDPTCRVLVGSLKAAGVGLTLTASSTVVFAELDWTPATLTQAEDRCHRIGQRESVLVQHLVLAGTLDAKMARMCTEKQDVADAALDDEATYSVEGRQDDEAPEARRSRKLAEAMLTETDVTRIHAQVRYLAGRCDGAVREDDAGYNRLDANIGHSLAACERLSVGQADMAKRMLGKYARQLAGCPGVDVLLG